MITEEQCTKKACLFYASDFHLEMILLPYIKERMYKEEIIIFTENNLEESVNVLLTKINLNEKDKEKIKKINWKNTDESKLEKLKNEEERRLNIIVNGSYNYIKKINKKINEIVTNNIEIIDCFYIEDRDVDIADLSRKYGNILNTQKIYNEK